MRILYFLVAYSLSRQSILFLNVLRSVCNQERLFHLLIRKSEHVQEEQQQT